MLSNNANLFFILEHTPHTNPTEEFVREGIEWVKDLVIQQEK